MIENILIFVRNCVMAVLTAWAGIQIAEKAQSKPPEAMPIAAASTATPLKTSNDGCPAHSGSGGAPDSQPSSAATDPERTNPGAQPSVMTIR